MTTTKTATPTRVLGASLAFTEALVKHTNIPTLEAQQIRLLLSLYIHGTLNQIDLERYTGMKKSSNARNIARLGDGERPAFERGPGWIESFEDPANRRTKLVRLTPLGRTMLERAADEVAHFF